MRTLGPCCLLLALAACAHGDDDTGDTDAVDTEVETVDSEPAVGDVTVTVIDDEGEPLAGAPVVFHAPDGAVDGLTTTDAAGIATGEIVAGGAVTVVRDGAPITILDVRPGDEVRLAGTSFPAAPHVARVSVASYAGADGDTFSTGCDSTYPNNVDAPVEVSYGPGCLSPTGRLDVFATAKKGNETWAFTAALGLTVDGDGTTDVVLPTPWRTDWVSVGLSLNDAPEGVTKLSGYVITWRNGALMHTAYEDSALVSGGGATVTPRAPRDVAERSSVGFQVRFGEAYAYGFTDVIFAVEGDPSDTRVIRGDDVPTPAHALTWDHAEAGRPVIGWTGDTSLDAVWMRVGTTTTLGPNAWTVVAPGDVTSIRVPALPDDLAYLVPVEGTGHGGVDVRGATLDGVDARALRLRESDAFSGDFTAGGSRGATRTLASFPAEL